MRREITETAKTVEEAINSACAKLGCDRDDIEFEIVDLPKKTFLGLKIIPAKVRVWKEEADKPEPEKQIPQPRVQQPQKRQQPAPAAQQSKSKQEEPMPPKEEKAIEMTGEVAAKAEAGKAYLSSVCREMGLEPTFTARIEDGGLCINVEGDGLGAMIGRRGETLDALQYLTGLVVNRLDGDYLRVTVDCGDYRTKRKSTLEALAKKLSAQVLKTNASKTLEPMNPFERRIIHATVSEIEGVSSTSIGEEPNRRVVITTPTARPVRGSSNRSNRDNSSKSPGRASGSDDRRRGGGGRGRRGAPPRREPRLSTQGGTINTLPQQGQRPGEAPTPSPQPLQQPPKATPETSSADKPLYTKLDLE